MLRIAGAHFVAFGTVLEVGDEEDESIWRTEVQRAGILQHNWLTGSFEDIKLRGHEGGISCLHLDHGHLVSGSGSIFEFAAFESFTKDLLWAYSLFCLLNFLSRQTIDYMGP
jgi:hypothetical protein